MPRFLPLVLLPLLPLVFVLGHRVAERACGERALAKVVGPVCAVALWVLSVHVAALVAHNFWTGLFAGTIGIAVLGAAAIFVKRPELPQGEPLGWGPLIGAGVAVLLMFGLEARFFLWDEMIVTGHQSIPQEMLNGFYPPRHLSFAQFELKYHYGFDLLVAMVGALAGQPEPFWKLVHGVTLALFALAGALTWVAGDRLIRPGAGRFTFACVACAGGVPLGCKIEPDRTAFVNCSLLPELPGNFLQHPWSLGIPIGLGAILLFATRRTRDLWWWGGLTLLLVALSLSQVVFFGCLMLAIGVSGVLTGSDSFWRRVVTFGPFGALVFGSASLLHGFFAHVADPPSFRLEFHPFWKNPLGSFESYVFYSLGTAVLLGPIGLFRLKRERLLLGTLMVFPFGVYQFFRYPDSWDVAKFLMMTQLPLGIATSAVFADWLTKATPTLWLKELAFAATIGLGLEFYLVGYFADGGDVFVKDAVKWQSPADRAIAGYLRRHIGLGEVVLRTDAPWEYAILAGLPSTHVDWGTSSFGFSHKTWDTRSALMDHPSDDIGKYLDLSIVWFVLGASDKDKTLRANAEKWVAAGRAEDVLSSGPLTLFHLLR